MLNTGLRGGEVCGIKNSDIDLENRVVHIRRGVKEIHVREEDLEYNGRLEVRVGKPKSSTSMRDIPLNDTAIEMIKSLQEEVYLGEDKPLIPDENGNFTNPRNMRNRFYRILKAAKVKRKGLHALRHTFAATLINGIRQPDGTLKTLTVKQVADLHFFSVQSHYACQEDKQDYFSCIHKQMTPNPGSNSFIFSTEMAGLLAFH